MVLAALAVLAAAPAQAKTIALVVGVAKYPDPRAELSGPAYDAPAVVKLLIDKMGAAPSDVHTLLDAQATRDAIRAELTGLVDRSAPGDTVVIYFSGHGTSARDTENGGLDLPSGTGAFVPYDIFQNKAPRWRDRLIVGRFDLGPLALTPLDQGGRTVIVLLDSCFSGNGVRGIRSGARYRYLPIGVAGDVVEKASPSAEEAASPPYPYRNVVMISASAETEKARDLSAGDGTLSGTPQGAFTDALLRVFAGDARADFNGDGVVSFEELHRAEVNYMAAHGIAQTPQLLPSIAEDKTGLIFRAVPGLKALPVAATRYSVTVAAGAASIRPALAQIGGVVFDQAHADLMVAPHGDGLRLTNAAGDIVADSVGSDQAVARVKAGQWASAVEHGGRAHLDLRADTTPTAKGGTFIIGHDHLKIAASTSAPATIAIVDLSSDGALTVLYPLTVAELAPLPANQMTTVPDGAPIDATPPAGLDRVLVLAFPNKPDGLETWAGLKAAYDSAQAQGFVAWLARQDGAYAATAIDVRVMEAAR
jgi:hypothetical protein